MEISFIILLMLYGVYPIISFIWITKHIQKLEQTNRNVSLLLLTTLVLTNGIFISMLGLYSYGVWWFFMAPFCLSPPIIGIIGGIRTSRQNTSKTSHKLFIANTLLLISFLISPFQTLAIEKFCNEITKMQANDLILGIEQYKIQNGKYPESLSDVSPDFVEHLPTASCLKPYKVLDRFYRDYRIEYCSKDLLQLTVHSTDLQYVQIYNFPYHQWTRFESFDYSRCHPPRN